MGSASLAQPPPPAQDTQAQEGSDDAKQQAVDEQAEVGHGSRSCEGEPDHARVCPLRGEFSTAHVASTVNCLIWIRHQHHIAHEPVCGDRPVLAQ